MTQSEHRVLVTGGSGFIGTNLVEHFRSRLIPVCSVDIAPPRLVDHESLWQGADIRDVDQLTLIVNQFRPTHVFHLAARTDLDADDVAAYDANTVGVDSMIATVGPLGGLQRIVFASSRMVCKIGYRPRDACDYCPTNAYGASKVEGEKIVRARAQALPWTIVRPTSIWGPWFDVPYKQYFLQIAQGRYFHISRRPVRKSFGYVGNTVRQLDRLAFAPDATGVEATLYLADPPIEVHDMAERIRAELGAPRIPTVPVAVARVAAIAGDAARKVGYANPPLTRFRLDNLLTEMLYDLDPLLAIVGPPLVSLDDGIRATVQWLRGQGEA